MSGAIHLVSFAFFCQDGKEGIFAIEHYSDLGVV